MLQAIGSPQEVKSSSLPRSPLIITCVVNVSGSVHSLPLQTEKTSKCAVLSILADFFIPQKKQGHRSIVSRLLVNTVCKFKAVRKHHHHQMLFPRHSLALRQKSSNFTRFLFNIFLICLRVG